MHCETINIKSEVSDDNPLGYIVINLEDFDPAKHEKFDTDAADEQTDTAKALTVPQIKEALAAKGIEIPEGVTKKADLQALLDAAA
jgi:hypothetical protein